MGEKYPVPALGRADAVLKMLCGEPYQWKLSDLSKKLDISKSTLHSLLLTMEQLGWVHRDRHDTFALGTEMGRFGSSYIQQFDLLDEFEREAESVMELLEETIQLARLEQEQVLYLARVLARTPVQIVSEPGVRFPAHATGLGKSLMCEMEEDDIKRIFQSEKLPKMTVHTICSRDSFIQELLDVRKKGYAIDEQECVMGFCCVSAPVRKAGSIVAAVSCSMPIHQWLAKKEKAIDEIVQLSQRLSS